MKFECPNCKQIGIAKSLFNLSDNLSCSHCYSRYRYKEKHPWMFNAVHFIAMPISCFIGWELSSWLAFFISIFGIQLVVHHLYPNKKQLIATGLRARNDR